MSASVLTRSFVCKITVSMSSNSSRGRIGGADSLVLQRVMLKKLNTLRARNKVMMMSEPVTACLFMCDTYIVSPFGDANNLNPTCLFTHQFCLDPEKGIRRIDAGSIDLFLDLGMIAPARDHSSIRNPTECGPVPAVPRWFLSTHSKIPLTPHGLSPLFFDTCYT